MHHIKEGRQALIEVYSLKTEEAIKLEETLISVCKDTCRFLDQSIGHYGDVAFDVIIDRDLKVWILEVNKRYVTDTLKKHPDPSLRAKICSNPLVYAKSLTVFK